MNVKNDQLSNPIRPKSLHMAGCNGVDKADWIVLEKDRFPSQNKLFARRFGDLSTLRKGKISKKFNVLDGTPNAVERSLGKSRSRTGYPGRVSTVANTCSSDSEPVRRLSCRRGSSKFGNGRE
jgi:hypothetical protein